MRPVTLAFVSGALLLLSACGGGGGGGGGSDTSRRVDMGTLTVNAGPTPVHTVTDPEYHLFVFEAGVSLSHTVTVTPDPVTEKPELCVYAGDFHVAEPSLPLECVFAVAEIPEDITFVAVAGASYTVQVFNASPSTTTSASYTVAVTQP